MKLANTPEIPPVYDETMIRNEIWRAEQLRGARRRKQIVQDHYRQRDLLMRVKFFGDPSNRTYDVWIAGGEKQENLSPGQYQNVLRGFVKQMDLRLAWELAKVTVGEPVQNRMVF